MELKAQFEQDGFAFLRAVIPQELILGLEDIIVSRARFDLAALGFSTEAMGVFDLLRALEKASPQRFYRLCSIGTSVAGLRIAASRSVSEAVGTMMDRPASHIFPFPPAIFFNDRPVTRLQYRWHQESSYLGAYEKFTTVWFPLFRDLTSDDGPMVVARGSHKEVFPYSFSKEPNGVTQFSVADNIAARFEQVPCAIKRGDAVLFHRDLLHKTGENLSGNPRISIVIRYFDVIESPEYLAMIVPNNVTKKDDVAAKAVSDR